jgi:putative SOS response-associated peptidase YedK
MPVVLDPAAEAAWLDPDLPAEEALALLVPAAEDALVAREVGDFVNDVRKDGPELIAPRDEQGALF